MRRTTALLLALLLGLSSIGYALTADEAITRFKSNEERIDDFTNELGTYTTSNSTTVETLPSFIIRKDQEVSERYILNMKGAWLTATEYALNDLVTEDGQVYLCIVAHESDVFATDLAAGDWVFYQGFSLDGLYYANSLVAITAANGDATVEEIILTAPITLTGDLVISKGFNRIKGAVITTNGHTLTVTYPHLTGTDQAFAAAAGEVILGPDNGMEIIPDWWGDDADDAEEIQAAADAVKYITAQSAGEGYSQNAGAVLSFVPGKAYTSSASLFFGGTTTNCVRFIRGNGAVIVSTAADEPAVDNTGGYRQHWENLNIEGDETDIPSVGLLLARNTSGISAGNGLFNRINIKGAFTYSPLYNYSSEADTFQSCIFGQRNGQTSAILNRSNTRGIISPNTTIATGEQSSTNLRFINCSFWNTTPSAATADSSCLEIDSFQDGLIQNCSFVEYYDDEDDYRDKPSVRILNNGNYAPNNWTFMNNRLDTIAPVVLQFEAAIVNDWIVKGNHWGMNTNGPSNARYQITNTVATDFRHCWFEAPNIKVDYAGSNIQYNCTLDVSGLLQLESSLAVVGEFEGTAILRDNTVFTYEAATSKALVQVPEQGVQYRHAPHLTYMTDAASSGTGLQTLVTRTLTANELREGATLHCVAGGTIAGTADAKTILFSIQAVTFDAVSAGASDVGDWWAELDLTITSAADDCDGLSRGGFDGGTLKVESVHSVAIDFTALRNILLRANPASAADTITAKYFKCDIR